MHELSIALRIVEALDEELSAEDEELTVTAVSIQVGTLTGLVPEALQFSWDMATADTRLEGAQLHIETVHAIGFCAACQRNQTLTNLQSMRCPTCQTPIQQIMGGNELEILTMEVE